MVAVPNYNQIVVPLFGKTHNRLGWVPPPRLAANANPMLRCRLGDLFLPHLEILIRPFLLTLKLSCQVRVPRQWLPHPQRRQLRVVMLRRHSRPLKRPSPALPPVITNQEFLIHWHQNVLTFHLLAAETPPRH